MHNHSMLLLFVFKDVVQSVSWEQFFVLAMPPAKRRRLTQAANNKTIPHAPETVGDVAPARIQLRDWIDMAYSLRHESGGDDVKWPLGGTFQDIVQRCWTDDSRLYDDSLAFVKRLGLMDSEAAEEDFLDKYMALQDTGRDCGSIRLL